MKFERHHEILKRLSKFGSVKVSDLSNSLMLISSVICRGFPLSENRFWQVILYFHRGEKVVTKRWQQALPILMFIS